MQSEDASGRAGVSSSGLSFGIIAECRKIMGLASGIAAREAIGSRRAEPHKRPVDARSFATPQPVPYGLGSPSVNSSALRFHSYCARSGRFRTSFLPKFAAGQIV